MLRWIVMIAILFGVLAPAWSQDDAVVVETNPRNPIKGEVFQILFKCQTSGDNEPDIDFKPEGFEVLGKQIQGLSTRTIYQNGKLTVNRELLVSYDARADKTGVIHLREVVVKIDGKVIREPVVSIQVMAAPPEPRLIFIAAEVPKKSVYVGEGITVRYYLYKKTSLQAFDIKKYPKLDGFMKRYLQENENTQRVTVDGELFGRSTIYSARLYPERAGKLVIDPMDISATYAQDLFGNMGFGFGLGMRDLKTKTFSSEPVTVEVKPLPEAGKPSSFKGLVGKHQFDVKVARSQLLVNEPMDVRLTVSGAGNLENYEAPELWDVPQLEKFDAKADLGLVGGDSAIKTFDYTFLGKRNGDIEETKVEFSYFDPDTGRYEVDTKILPRITVAGGQAAEAPTLPTKSNAPIEKPNEAAPEKFVSGQSWWQQLGFWWALLAIVAAAGIYWRGRDYWQHRQVSTEAWERDLQRIQAGDFTSAELVRVLYALAPESTANVRQVLASSSLSEGARQYFVQLLDQAEDAEYNRSRQKATIVVDKKMLKELRGHIRG